MARLITKVCIESSGNDIHRRLAGEVSRAKVESTKQRTEITLTPEGKGYRLSGEWDWWGMYVRIGVGGQDCSLEATIRFAAELAA